MGVGPKKHRAIVLSVVDGDTIRVDFDSSRQLVRLCGIDAPEARANKKALRDSNKSGISVGQILIQGTKATAFVKKLLSAGQIVYLEFDVEKRDRYDRLLAYVYLPDGRMLNELLVKEGYAKPYPIGPNLRYAGLFERLAADQ